MRLPQGFAIELALVHGIPLEALREVMTALNRTWQLNIQGLDTADENKLRSAAIKALKQKSGLHAQYVELLPLTSPPSVAVALLSAITELACGTRQGPWTLRA